MFMSGVSMGARSARSPVSSPVTTQTTPGMAAASLVSMDTMRACGCVLR